MKIELRDWPGSVIQQTMLVSAVGKFLRTHHKGGQRLLEWLKSVPADRTEAEYRQLRREAEEQKEAGINAHIADYNARQRAAGGNEIDRHGNVISGPGAPRNLKQLERHRADRDEIRKLLRNKPQLTAKQILRILGWPLSRLRTVERHVKEFRDR
jgi:hypothetical protein